MVCFVRSNSVVAELDVLRSRRVTACFFEDEPYATIALLVGQDFFAIICVGALRRLTVLEEGNDIAVNIRFCLLSQSV